jgi:hypothetical protein
MASYCKNGTKSFGFNKWGLLFLLIERLTAPQEGLFYVDYNSSTRRPQIYISVSDDHYGKQS